MAAAVAESMPGIAVSWAAVAVLGSTKPPAAALSPLGVVAGVAAALAAAESAAAAESLAASFGAHAAIATSRAAAPMTVSGVVGVFIGSPEVWAPHAGAER